MLCTVLYSAVTLFLLGAEKYLQAGSKVPLFSLPGIGVKKKKKKKKKKRNNAPCICHFEFTYHRKSVTLVSGKINRWVNFGVLEATKKSNTLAKLRNPTPIN